MTKDLLKEIERLQSDLSAMISEDKYEPCLRDGDTGTYEFIPGIPDELTRSNARKRLEEIAGIDENTAAKNLAFNILYPPEKPLNTYQPSYSSNEESDFIYYSKKLLIGALIAGALYFAFDYYKTKSDLKEIKQRLSIKI